MGYYITTEPGTDDKTIGNPQLDVSEVEGWDARVEYLFGDLGDLVAGSFFVKEIEDPIESILISDQATFSGEANFQTFFNNPTTADLLGFEVETRLHLGLFGLLGPLSDFMDNFSIGGNYTWIDAEVDRSPFELGRPADYFGVADGDVEVFTGLEATRRLFNQPRWIANADVSFEHPDLGTKVTLAWFGISDVLTTVGGATLLQPGNAVEEYTLDRYDDSYYQLDLILSQDFHLPWELGTLTFKSSIKNLTDSKRKVIYDRGQLYGADVAERAYRVGRDYSFALKFTHDFGL
jgi:outer membrane receptor protein involved in Fe transport